MNPAFVHPLSDVQTNMLGEGTHVWQFSVILKGARIGRCCNICAHTFIEGDVIVGDNVTIKCGVQLWNGTRIGNNVFIGPNATFCNDRYPKSGNRNFKCEGIIIEDNVSIGANVTLLPGVRIAAGSMVGAGAVVVRDVPPGVTVVGNPAQIME